MGFTFSDSLKYFDGIIDSALFAVNSGILQNDVVERLTERFQYIEVKNIAALPNLTTAACLAHQGLLRSVTGMKLSNVDLTSVPAQHLASLTACVTGDVIINNVSNCALVSILDSLKCQVLRLNSQSLSSEETRAMVRAMESRVERLRLGCWGEVSLDIRALTQYSGQGKCGWVMCYDDTAHIYGEEVRSWAQRIIWRVNSLMGGTIDIQR